MQVGFGLALLSALVVHFDARHVLAKLGVADLRFITGAALLIGVATTFGAINAHLFINLDKRLPFFSFLPLFWASWAFGLVLPGQVGDVASLAALLRQRGVHLSATIGRSFVDKLISVLVMLAFAAIGLYRLPNIDVSLNWLSVPVLLIIAGLPWRRRVAHWASTRRGRMARFAISALREAKIAAIQHPWRLSGNALLTTVKIVLVGESYWCAFRALGYDGHDNFQVVFLAAASSMVAYLPISFNGIGTVEIAGVILFGWLGVPQAVVLSGYLLLRAMVLVIAWIPAGLWLLVATPRQQHG